MPLAAGTRLGPCEIHSPIGAGGMGEVYRATDTRLDRTVAIKVLPPLLADAPQFRERFEREAKSISHFSHPNICTLQDHLHCPSRFSCSPVALSGRRNATCGGPSYSMAGDVGLGIGPGSSSKPSSSCSNTARSYFESGAHATTWWKARAAE